MKLALIGGGGVRAPLFVTSALRRAERMNLEELCLMDIEADKLIIMGEICRLVTDRAGSQVRITTTTDPREALEGAGHVVTSIRVGGDYGRVLDERIALRHGVLGQETTGPGGFAMALRSIPALLGYATLMDDLSPDAWMFNFTNPAGLVTQALRDAGFSRTIGICDGANQPQHAVAHWLQLPAHQVQPEVYGLNHLSWARRIWVNGKDVWPQLLGNQDFLAHSELRVFEPELVQQMGVWLNEYLYYYYYSEKAVDSIEGDELTRGEEILRLNEHLLEQLGSIDIWGNQEETLQIYYGYNYRRGATYMHYARSDAPDMDKADKQTYKVDLAGEEGEGYAGVALSIIEAFEACVPLHIALNVPNEGAIDCMRPKDVVEVSCLVDEAGIHPQPIGDIPQDQELLMRQVKLYERLTVAAVRDRSRATAVQALMAHPLVLSYSRAKVLVDEYLKAHAPYVGDWD